MGDAVMGWLRVGSKENPSVKRSTLSLPLHGKDREGGLLDKGYLRDRKQAVRGTEDSTAWGKHQEVTPRR